MGVLVLSGCFGDPTPPPPVTDLQATPATTAVHLSWTNPPPGSWGVIVRRTEGSVPPSGPEAGILVADVGDDTSVTDTGLLVSTTYSYAVFTYGADDYWSPAVTTTVTTTPIQPVSDLQATSTATSVSLTWVNPGPPFSGAMVRRAVGSTPPPCVPCPALPALSCLLAGAMVADGPEDPLKCD